MVAKIVEDVFTRYTNVLGIVVDGREIRTTGEHLFYVKGYGWTAANELRLGDKFFQGVHPAGQQLRTSSKQRGHEGRQMSRFQYRDRTHLRRLVLNY